MTYSRRVNAKRRVVEGVVRGMAMAWGETDHLRARRRKAQRQDLIAKSWNQVGASIEVGLTTAAPRSSKAS